ncbi:MAG: DUF4286 family protein [Ginsengibacter sp.]
MFIYNITTKVDHAILNDWLQWQREIHIPGVMATGSFTEHRFYKLLEHDDDEGSAFVTQFMAATQADYDQYLLQFAPQLRKETLEKWGDQVVSFRTLLQNVQ